MSIYMRTAVLSALLFSLHAANTSKTSKSVVRVEGGLVEGSASSKPGVMVFKGIPYAAAPVGELRWKEPQPAAKWKGVRQADQFGPRCMQIPYSKYMVFRDEGSSEDCLHLTVWTPAKSASAKLPVMFWIHGGAYQLGASSEPRQDGEALAAKGTVVVSINYRLGVFGFFAHPDLTKESAHHASGYYGLMDQLAALRWVHRNIEAFGGDPNNVTVFGESAGSFSISAFMASPLSHHLFAKAIGESGAFFGPTMEAKPLKVAEDLGVKIAASQSTDLAGLRALPAEKLLAIAHKQAPISFQPIVDGYFLPAPPAEIFTAGKQTHVPLLAGWNADEYPWDVVGVKEKITQEHLQAKFREKFASDADAVQAAYSASSDEGAAQALRDFSGDEFIGYSTWKWIDLQARTGGKPVYRYFFTRVPPAKPGAMFGPVRVSELGAVHSSEIEYVFGTLDTSTEFSVHQPEDYKLSELMQTYWTNFAKTGDPNGPGLPAWCPYKDVMRLDVDAGSAPETHRERYEALDRVYSRAASK